MGGQKGEEIERGAKIKKGPCGSKRNKRYDSSSLLTDDRWFIYKHCSELLEMPDWFDRLQGRRQLSTGR